MREEFNKIKAEIAAVAKQKADTPGNDGVGTVAGNEELQNKFKAF